MEILSSKTLFQLNRGVELQKSQVLQAIPQIKNPVLSIDLMNQIADAKAVSLQTLQNYHKKAEGLAELEPSVTRSVDLLA